VRAGTGIFTLLGFMGLYLFVGILYLVLILRIVNQGPEAAEARTTSVGAAAT
jgi:cytochrome d ubiquinol oxidase subunit I